MNRREVIKSMGLISLHALFPSVLSGFLASCNSGEQPPMQNSFFTSEQQEILTEVVDLILPKTSTRAAAEVGVPRFLDEVFSLCLDAAQQQFVKEGMSGLQKDWGTQADKTAYLTALDARAYENDEDAAWFKTLKQFTLIGFFTSEEGSTKAGQYLKVPEGYVGDIQIDENTLAQAKTALRI